MLVQPRLAGFLTPRARKCKIETSNRSIRGVLSYNKYKYGIKWIVIVCWIGIWRRALKRICWLVAGSSLRSFSLDSIDPSPGDLIELILDDGEVLYMEAIKGKKKQAKFVCLGEVFELDQEQQLISNGFYPRISESWVKNDAFVVSCFNEIRKIQKLRRGPATFHDSSVKDPVQWRPNSKCGLVRATEGPKAGAHMTRHVGDTDITSNRHDIITSLWKTCGRFRRWSTNQIRIPWTGVGWPTCIRTEFDRLRMVFTGCATGHVGIQCGHNGTVY